ncbi:MAG: PH domain-containing protein [Sphingomonas sp.]
MALDIVPLLPLERGQLHVMRVRGAIFALALLAIALVVEFVALDRVLGEYGVRKGTLTIVAGALSLWMVAIAPARRWRHWGYAFTGSELHVSHGWLFQVHTIVPVARVQHIDVAQGPIERAFGVTTLVLHTAGTEASTVSLPGVARETAEGIRDAIRAHIGRAHIGRAHIGRAHIGSAQ